MGLSLLKVLSAFLIIFVAGLSATFASGGMPLTPRHAQKPVIDQPVLLVVHASYEFDTNGSARQAIDHEIRRFKERRLPVVYLVSDLSSEGIRNWYTEDRSPDYLIYSAGGEHNLALRSADVTVVGGFFGNYDMHSGCHTQALRSVVDSYFRLQKQVAPLSVHLPLSAIYFWMDDSLLRQKVISHFSQPKNWIQEISELLFSREFSNDGEIELGRPFFYKSKKPQLVQNPFLDVVVPGSNYNPQDDIDNPMSFVNRNGRAVAKDGRYEEADPVDLQKYQFILSTSSNPDLMTFGKGLRKVQFIFSPE